MGVGFKVLGLWSRAGTFRCPRLLLCHPFTPTWCHCWQLIGWLSKVWSLFGSLFQYGTSYLGYPNRDHIFDNHPIVGLGSNNRCRGTQQHHGHYEWKSRWLEDPRSRWSLDASEDFKPQPFALGFRVEGFRLRVKGLGGSGFGV